MNNPEDQRIEMERGAAEFEKLLEQLDRLSSAHKKTGPQSDEGKKFKDLKQARG
jgi:hypothetical protein